MLNSNSTNHETVFVMFVFQNFYALKDMLGNLRIIPLLRCHESRIARLQDNSTFRHDCALLIMLESHEKSRPLFSETALFMFYDC